MRVLTCVVLLCAVAARGDICLNGSWDFRFDEGVAGPSVSSPVFEATGKMVVPGCFDALPQAFMKRGTAMYRRTFVLNEPKVAAWLVIDGMGLYGRFWLDGREIGVDDLPYARIELATGPLSAGEHELVVAVDNRFDWSYQKLAMPHYDFHLWGGFYHGVSLAFDNRKLLVRTRDYATGTVEIEAVNFPSPEFDTTLVFDGTNRVRTTFARGRTTVAVPGFRLWSPDAPNLHRVAVDGVGARFGIRTLEAKKGGFYLNGRRIFLKGANRHEQQYQLGAATPEGYMLTDIQNLKAMGGNFFRGAHYQQAQRFLDLCDEMGVMVWEESLGWGNGWPRPARGKERNTDFDDERFCAKQIEQTRLMVRSSFNHPAVVVFAFLNECTSGEPRCKALTEKLFAAVRAEDSGRLVTFACSQIAKDVCLADADFVSFNTYPGTIHGYPGTATELVGKMRDMEGFGVNWSVRHFQKRYPGKTIFISEMGTAAQWGARDPSCTVDTEDFQDEHNRLVAETVWANPAIAGIAFWQFFDTRTSGRECAGDGKKHQGMSWAGLFDRERRPKLTVGTLADYFKNRMPANLTVEE